MDHSPHNDRLHKLERDLVRSQRIMGIGIIVLALVLIVLAPRMIRSQILSSSGEYQTIPVFHASGAGQTLQQQQAATSSRMQPVSPGSTAP